MCVCVCVCVFVQAASQTSLLTDDDMDEELDKDVQTEEDQLNGFPDDYLVVIHKLRKEVCVCPSLLAPLSRCCFFLLHIVPSLVPSIHRRRKKHLVSAVCACM